MIYTCTLNPSIDYFIEVDDFQLGALNRTKAELKRPGGKGINVSRVLKNVGVESVALGFIGGFTGQFIIDSLKKDQMETDFVHVQADTRINIKLHVGSETEINGAGPVISEHELESLINKIKQLKDGDILLLAGSIPSTLPDDLYEQIIKLVSNKQVKVIVDASKDLLKAVLPYKPFLIKPNHHELGELFDVTINEVEEAIPYGKKLIEMGAEHVIVSMGEKGSILFFQDQIYFANIPQGKLVNAVGAGDSVVAGFIASYVKDNDVVEAFRYGATSGSATAYSEGLATKSQIEELISQVHVKSI